MQKNRNNLFFSFFFSFFVDGVVFSDWPRGLFYLNSALPTSTPWKGIQYPSNDVHPEVSQSHCLDLCFLMNTENEKKEPRWCEIRPDESNFKLRDHYTCLQKLKPTVPVYRGSLGPSPSPLAVRIIAQQRVRNQFNECARSVPDWINSWKRAWFCFRELTAKLVIRVDRRWQ